MRIEQISLEPSPAPREPAPDEPPRFAVHTFGCQMNVHDSEKVENLLLHHGWARAQRLDDADLVIVNTCSIREKAEHRLYTDLGVLRAWKQSRPARAIGVGGCVAQQQGDRLLARFPQLDFVFGTHNLRFVPALAAAARSGARSARTEARSSLDRFDLPERHPDFASATPGRAFLTVMEGCDMFCSFCIVPLTRGREISRPFASIVAEAESLAASGVRELVLLGQTVNAYGRHDLRRDRAAESGTEPFASLLVRLAAIPGIVRLRYTSPHPGFFDDALVRAHGELDALCPHVHLPVQSGSDAVLARMRRRYGRDELLRLADRLRAARADLALTTDLIVGFPGESDRDFDATLDLVARVGFVDGYSFKYSPRPGTAAASDTDVVPEDVKRTRLEAVQRQLREQTLRAHRERVGGTSEILVEGPSRAGQGQIRGRDPWHRVINVGVAPSISVKSGSLLPVRIIEALPHCLIGEALAQDGSRAL